MRRSRMIQSCCRSRKDVKFTENGQRLEIPDAHWKTMTGKGKYRLFVTDPEAGQVACIATIREEGDAFSPIALRLKVKKGQITEIEAFVTRSTTPAGPHRCRTVRRRRRRLRFQVPRIPMKKWECPILYIWKPYRRQSGCPART